MKKYLTKSFFLFVMALFLMVASQNQTEAADYYLGEYANGQVAYLDTSSIRTENHYVQGYHEGDTYRCTVKAVWLDSNQYDRISYTIYIGQTEMIEKNGTRVYQTMRGPHNYLDENPVEYALVKYFTKVHTDDWHKVPEHIR